jgi:hypothetical protein
MDDKHVIWSIIGAIIVSVIIIIGFVVVVALIVTHAAPFDEFQRQTLSVVVGTLSGAFSAGVVGFWLGSSMGSTLKNGMLRSFGPAESGEGRPGVK